MIIILEALARTFNQYGLSLSYKQAFERALLEKTLEHEASAPADGLMLRLISHDWVHSTLTA